MGKNKSSIGSIVLEIAPLLYFVFKILKILICAHANIVLKSTNFYSISMGFSDTVKNILKGFKYL